MVAYARKNKEKVDEPEKVLETINEIPARTYHTMAEVIEATSEELPSKTNDMYPQAISGIGFKSRFNLLKRINYVGDHQ